MDSCAAITLHMGPRLDSDGETAFCGNPPSTNVVSGSDSGVETLVRRQAAKSGSSGRVNASPFAVIRNASYGWASEKRAHGRKYGG